MPCQTLDKFVCRYTSVVVLQSLWYLSCIERVTLGARSDVPPCLNCSYIAFQPTSVSNMARIIDGVSLCLLCTLALVQLVI